VDQVTGCGIGLRREHFQHVLDAKPQVPWFEVISENFMTGGGRPQKVLESVRRDYAVALHGVSLSLGSAEPVDETHLRLLKSLADWVEPSIVSDHLCWTRYGGHNSHDLLPLPHTAEAVENAATNIARVQEVLRRRILIENVSSYVRLRDQEMEEWEFLAAVAEKADCHILLDVNNVYVNARNHGFDPRRFLNALPADRIRQMHLAGHEDNGHVVVDTHDQAICEPVWALYQEALALFGPVPTLIERDVNVPEFLALHQEATRAQRLMGNLKAAA